MEISVTVLLDVDGKVVNKRNPGLKTLPPDRRQAAIEQGVQGVVTIALEKHFSEGVTVSFVKADIVPQS